MLKTHAQTLKTVIERKERYHNPDMHVDIVPDSERIDVKVRVTGSKGLIDSMTHEHT